MYNPYYLPQQDVDSELQDAEQYHLNKKSLDYSIVDIVEEQ